MVEYGCNVTNKFGFMSDDDEFDDPQELITRVAQLEAEKAAAQKKADKLAKQIASTPKETKSSGKENSKPSGVERGGRGGRGRGRGGGTRSSRQENELSERFGESRGSRGSRGLRGRGTAFRGRGGNVNGLPETVKSSQNNGDEVTNDSVIESYERRGRTGRGTFNSERRARGVFRGGRQFDRQSGSVRGRVRGIDKKDGYGRGNWGDDKDELVGETEPLNMVEEPEAPREKTAEELAQEALEAELAKQKTLKEYIDSQKKEAPKFNVRKAGEGEQEILGKLVKLQKEVVVDKEEEEVSIIRREPREKALHIDIQFAEPNRNYRGERDFYRGDRLSRGRGGPRGGRGARGAGRGQAPPNFDSSLDAFPALGSK
ncbi:hyaluronan / mRNA binding family protein [Dictyocaulus viviparus]|uniref:Hyaluronan / mRNA binding family protein n=1 Tax=Dictyocaulus viviparus TaxID=29172 RepID=A0A0D8XW31_DICVI|nr:hyaluronan / mRNA binding family protein [Dictyocaulus viviparus]